MIRSMTAFAKAEKNTTRCNVSVEIRTVNSKYLDIALKLPSGYDPLEDQVRTLINSQLERGRVDVRIRVQHEPDAVPALTVDESRAKAIFQALTALKETLEIDGDVRLSHMTNYNSLIVPVETEPDLDGVWPDIRDGVNEALTALIDMRAREGGFIAADFEKRLTAIEEMLDRIDAASSVLPAAYRDRLRERIATLTKGLVEIDEGRIAQEAAFLADRSDISEEIVRARSHLEQFKTIMTDPEPAGRKLNFLLQEMNREFNTMGAKAGNTEIAHTIVSVKSELEKIREQVQNIE